MFLPSALLNESTWIRKYWTGTCKFDKLLTEVQTNVQNLEEQDSNLRRICASLDQAAEHFTTMAINTSSPREPVAVTSRTPIKPLTSLENKCIDIHKKPRDSMESETLHRNTDR